MGLHGRNLCDRAVWSRVALPVLADAAREDTDTQCELMRVNRPASR